MKQWILIPNDLPEDFEMTIREAEDYYDITIDNQYHSYYKIKKKTGEICDAGHKHYVPEKGE